MGFSNGKLLFTFKNVPSNFALFISFPVSRRIDDAISFISSGTAIGIDSQGRLIVEDKNGQREKIISGEVSVRGLYGYV